MRLKALVLSVALAALGVGLAWLYTRRLEPEVAGGPPIAVLTITRSLEPGTTLPAQHLAVRVQEGLAEVSSTTLLELERRAAARAPTGPTRVDSR